MRKVLVDKYEIIREIGLGGAGRVYLAYDRHLRLEVAVKELAWKAAKEIGTLWHEVDVLKQMEHPALPAVYDFFHDHGCDYMVMEYIRGINLADYVKENGALKQHQAIFLMRKLLSVIEYLHSFNPPIIHRDLKPGNIMLGGDNRIKLVDFGTAFMLYGDGRPIVSGTPGFTAPELFLAGSGYHENSDIYSLGAIFSFVLTGKVPDARKIPRRIGKPQRISGGVKKIIARCLRANPEKRYQNVYQLKDDLKNFRYFEADQVVKRFIRKGIRLCVPPGLFYMGIMMVYRECLRFGIPLMIRHEKAWGWNGDFPITYGLSAGVLLMLGGLYFLLAGLGQKNNNVRIVKSICLSDKKSVGLWGLIAFGVILAAAMRADVHAVANESLANSQHMVAELPIFIRDQDGCKVLIQNGAVYRPQKDIILEIPISQLPPGVGMTLKVVVEGGEWLYESREYLVMVE